MAKRPSPEMETLAAPPASLRIHAPVAERTSLHSEADESRPDAQDGRAVQARGDEPAADYSGGATSETWVDVREPPRPSGHDGAADDDLLPAGTPIGHYLVLEHLGEGAMGVVYAAYDPRLNRRVAIKLLRPARRRNKARLKASHGRLLREAQALAKLKDPHVVVVHDVGRVEDQVFVAMEFVDGPTLSEWMTQTRSLDELLFVFLRAGEGLAAAHRAGLVHRDFKPDNVMIDSRGRPRVMDFGLARASDEEELIRESGERSDEAIPHALATPLTRTGAVLGTPAYMAPEQHLGLGADARSDQFSFCVTLYEALYGVRPFAGTTVAQLGLAVTSGTMIEAPRDRQVPSWIKAVLHRGLSVDPKQRFEDMDALLAALRDDPRERRRKLVRWSLGGVGVVTLGAALWFGRQAEQPLCQGAEARMATVWSAPKAAQLRKAFDATGRSYAASTADQVVTSLDDFSQAWQGVHREACEATHIRKERSLELLDRQTVCLDRARSALHELVEIFELADAKAVDEAISAVDRLPEVSACADLDRVMNGVQPPATHVAAQVDQLRDELAAARARRLTGSPVAALERLQGLHSAVQEVDYPALSAEYDLERGLAHRFAGHYEKAAADLMRAYQGAIGSGYESIAAESSSELIYVSGYRLARHQAAESWVVSAQAWAQRVDPDGPVQAHVLHNTGVLLDAQGLEEQAEPNYRQALAIRRRVFGELHPLVARSIHNLGNIYLSRGAYDDAAEHYAKARDIYSEVLGAEHPEVAGSLNNLGVAYRRAGRFDEAVTQLRRATAIYEAALGPKHPDVALSLDNLGLALLGAGSLDEAKSTAQRSLAIRIDSVGADHPDVGDTRCTLAEIALQEGQLELALQQATAALVGYQKAFGESHPQSAIALQLRGQVQLAAGRPQLAITDFERALKVRTTHVAPAHDLAATHDGLARSHAALDHDDAAQTHRAAALSAYAKSGPGYAKAAASLEADLPGEGPRAGVEAKP